MQSHPMWVRGLKQVFLLLFHVADGVAPHVGAWIETVMVQQYDGTEAVAPHVGAWIETDVERCLTLSLMRRTPCGCVD